MGHWKDIGITPPLYFLNEGKNIRAMCENGHKSCPWTLKNVIS